MIINWLEAGRVHFVFKLKLNLNQTNAQIAEKTIPPVFTLKWHFYADTVIVIIIFVN